MIKFEVKETIASQENKNDETRIFIIGAKKSLVTDPTMSYGQSRCLNYYFSLNYFILFKF